MTAAAKEVHKGHCRCAGVKMFTHGEPVLSVYCHCDDCRRSTGSAVLASVGFEDCDISWTSRDTLGEYVKGTCTRLFCDSCGSPVAQQHESAPGKTFMNTAFMDEPDLFAPTYHTFAGQQIEWLELADDLPRHELTLIIKVPS